MNLCLLKRLKRGTMSKGNVQGKECLIVGLKKMLIIDGNSLVNRAYYALPPLTNREGIHTNGIYGFLTMLFKVREDIAPDYFAVAFDLKAPTFRHKEYKEYKAGRKKMPPELAEQVEPLKEILDALGIYRMELEGFEADDLIGTVTKLAEGNNCHTYIVSGDKDVLQLVSEVTTVMITKKGISQIEIYDPQKVIEEFEVPVEAMIDLKGLMGDSSDNIPGIPGVGIKTAIKLLKEFGSIDRIIEEQNKISNKKLKEKVEVYQEQLVLSKKLATIETGVPLDLSLEDMRPMELKYDVLMPLFRRFEFSRLLEKISKPEAGISDKRQEVSIHEITTMEQVREIQEKAADVGEVIYYTLMDDRRAPVQLPSAVAFILGDNHASGWFRLGDDETSQNMFDMFVDWLQDENMRKVTHDLKKECSWILEKNKILRGQNFDIMLADYLINPSKSSYALADMAAHYDGLKMEEPIEWLGKGKKKQQPQDVESNQIQLLLSKAINCIYGLHTPLREKLVEEQLDTLYDQAELPLTQVLAVMEHEGIGIDEDYLNQLKEEFEINIEENMSRIFDMAGVEFNLNSPKQLGEVLFEKLKLPPVKKTKTGFSTNAEVLEKLMDKHQIIPLILEYRQLTKIKNTYIDGLGAILNSETKRIYSTFHQAVTATGRISSSEPNLQNIPVKTEVGRRLRKIFVARKGYRFIDADYSQIELRIMAHLAKDEEMMKAFWEESDVHTRTAAQIFKTSIEEVTDSMRSQAKAVNFGIIYGISDYGLATNLNISRKEAQQYIDEYFQQYPGVKQYIDEMIKVGKEKGSVRTLMNRIRYIPEIHSRNFNQRSFGERLAMNTPIQGTAADIIKMAMVNVYRRLKDEGYQAKIILQVHDELIIEAPEQEIEAVAEILRHEMENTIKLEVPLKVDLSVAGNWYDAK